MNKLSIVHRIVLLAVCAVTALPIVGAVGLPGANTQTDSAGQLDRLAGGMQQIVGAYTL